MDIFQVSEVRLYTGMRIEGVSIKTKLFNNEEKAIKYAQNIVDTEGENDICIECNEICCKCKCCKSCLECDCSCCNCSGCTCSFCCKHVQSKKCCDHLFEDEKNPGLYWCNTPCCIHSCNYDCLKLENGNTRCGHTTEGFCQHNGPESSCCNHVCDEKCCQCEIPKNRFSKFFFKSISDVYFSSSSGGYEQWPDLTVSIKKKKLDLENDIIYELEYNM